MGDPNGKPRESGKWGRAAALLAVLALLSACKVDLYSGIEQKEANEILGLLLRAGIDADKVNEREGKNTIRVEKEHVEQAIAVLTARGLPRSRSMNIMDVFKSEGLIASANAERMRYIYAMSEELTGTLSQLDGVVAVRVHIAVPEARRNGKPEGHPSAAVFLKHQNKYDFQSYVPQIKKLVSNSIEDLPYDAVSVVLFPTDSNLLMPQRPGGETGGWWGAVQGNPLAASALGVAVLAALGGGGYLAWRNDFWRRRRQQQTS